MSIILRLSLVGSLTFLAACQPESNTTGVNGLVYCVEGSPESFNPQLVTSGHDDLTSSPPSSGLSPAASLECPP